MQGGETNRRVSESSISVVQASGRFEFLPKHGAVHGVREAPQAATPFHPHPPAQRHAAGPPHPL